MVVTLLVMLGLVVLAGLVVVYVAYPHRGEDVPSVPWVGEAMRKGVDRLPTLDNREGQHEEGRSASRAEPRGRQLLR